MRANQVPRWCTKEPPTNTQAMGLTHQMEVLFDPISVIIPKNSPNIVFQTSALCILGYRACVFALLRYHGCNQILWCWSLLWSSAKMLQLVSLCFWISLVFKCAFVSHSVSVQSAELSDVHHLLSELMKSGLANGPYFNLRCTLMDFDPIITVKHSDCGLK